MDDKALLFTIKAHKNQSRKNGKPYLVHPLSVALELAKNGADDELISAGLLHDTVEDAGITIEELKSTFGDKITDYVLFETENKKLSWEERKQNTIDALKNTDNRNYHMLVCADKLSNIKDIQNDITEKGEDAWSVFKRGKDKQKWLFESLVDALKVIDDLDMYQEFKNTVSKVFD